MLCSQEKSKCFISTYTFWTKQSDIYKCVFVTVTKCVTITKYKYISIEFVDFYFKLYYGVHIEKPCFEKWLR